MVIGILCINPSKKDNYLVNELNNEFGKENNTRKVKYLFNWLIGIFEAEGAVSKDALILTQSSSKKMLLMIQRWLGEGTMQSKDRRLIIRKKEVVKRFAEVLKENKRLRKTGEKLLKQGYCDEMEASRIKGISLRDGWLSGFIEGDGGFNITIMSRRLRRGTGKVSREYFTTRFYISQRGALSEMREIAKVLRGRIEACSGKEDTYRVVVSSKEGLRILKGYLEKFPLISEKKEDMNKWLRVVEMVLKGENRENTTMYENNIRIVKEYKKVMNQRNKTRIRK